MNYHPPAFDGMFGGDDDLDYYPNRNMAYPANNCCPTNNCCPPNNCCSTSKPDCVPDTCGCCDYQPIGIDQNPCIDKDCWKVYLDVSNFHPEDISVTGENRKIIVKAQKQLEPGICCVSNGFTREYELPQSFDPEDVCVCFSCDCILIITVPGTKYRNYPIKPCGPARCFVACSSNTNIKTNTKADPRDVKKEKVDCKIKC